MINMPNAESLAEPGDSTRIEVKVPEDAAAIDRLSRFLSRRA